MKSLITVILLLLYVGSYGQIIFPIDKTTGKITYSEVVTLKDSISKDELFSRAKICFTHLFKNSKSVIQNEDKEAGSIIGKGNLKVYARALGTNYDGGFVNFTITISVKQGRYKYTITDFNHENTGSTLPAGGNLENGKPKQWMQKQWENVLNRVDEEMRNLISSIKTEMSNLTPKTDNW